MTELQGKLTVTFFFVVLVSLVLSVLILGGKKNLSERTGCRLDISERPATFLVIDQSDPFERGDSERIAETTRDIIDSLVTDEKLVALEIDPEAPYSPKVLFERCAPKRESDLNWWLDNVIQARAATTKFSHDFDEATRIAFQAHDFPISPILQAIAYVSQRADFKIRIAQ